MTREEAIEILKYSIGVFPATDRAVSALDMAAKALEQESCEDAISRQAMLDGLASIAKAKAKSDAQKSLMGRVMFFTERLPSVNPQPKTGWIPVSEKLPEEYGEYLITWTTSQSKRSFIGISEGEVTSEYDHEHNRFKFEWLLEDYVKNYPDVEVIAWMPLPPSYQGE